MTHDEGMVTPCDPLMAVILIKRVTAVLCFISPSWLRSHWRLGCHCHCCLLDQCL